MSQYIINTGNIANDGQGDPLRTAFTDTNLNFNQIWAAGPVNSNIKIANNTIITTNTNGNLILATNGIGAIVTAQSVVPDLSNVRMVGAPNNRFNTVYSQYLDISGIVTAGNLSVSGNLYVAGNTVTVNQSNLSVSNTLITLAANATIPVEADGGGIFVAGANASLTYSSSLNSWVSNIALSVQGNVSADYFVGDGSGLSNLNVSVDANTLTGNRLNSGVVFSNLTTVGTLTSLTVDGNVLAGNITATFYGDGSNLSNLGNVGNAAYATFAGTAATANLAAQAVTAINADTALYAVNANTANTANFALTSNCAIYADTATTAILANSAIVANVALFAESVGVLSNLSVTGNIVTGGILTNNYYYANGAPFAGGGGSGSIIQSPTAPLNPTASTLWWDEVSGRLYVYYNDGATSQWVDAAPAGTGGGGGSASLVQSPAPPTNPTANTLWWDEVSGRLYVYYDDGTSSQWVDASPAGTGGGGSTGNITFNSTTISTNLANTDIAIQGNGTGAINIVTGANSYTQLQNDSYTNGSSYVYLQDGSVYVYTNGGGEWTFDNTGNLRFPDSTVQTTAYTGQSGGNTDWANIGNITNQYGPSNIAIGSFAGNDTQGSFAIAIGGSAGTTLQGEDAIAIGDAAGANAQGISSVAIGTTAGNDTQGQLAVAIGYSAGTTTQGITAVAIGSTAGQNNQGNNSVAIGDSAGYAGQGAQSVAVGASAAQNGQGQFGTAVGYYAGNDGQGYMGVAVGISAGQNAQGNSAVAIGANAGNIAQGTIAVAIGLNAGYTNQGVHAVAIGWNAGNDGQGNSAIAIGENAGLNIQGIDAVAIGDSAGQIAQSTQAVAIGIVAGQVNQGNKSVAIGAFAGQTDQANNSIILNATGAALNQTTPSTFTVAPVRNDTSNVTNALYYNTTTAEISYGPAGGATDWANIGNITGANGPQDIIIGYNAGANSSGQQSVAIGYAAGQTNQGAYAVAVGINSGTNTQGDQAVAVGQNAGNYQQGITAVGIGYSAGQTRQGQYAVAIGPSAGQDDQGNSAIAIGENAGLNIQGIDAVAIGDSAGQIAQSTQAVAIGIVAGQVNQGNKSVAIGAFAGNYYQGDSTVAIGANAGNTTQGDDGVAIGNRAGSNTQGIQGIAIGSQAAQTTQGTSAIAIGTSAGFINQGDDAIAIGRNAGINSQPPNSIILNASGNQLNGSGANALYIAPVRNDTSNITNALYYNTSTFEISYGPAAAGGNVSSLANSTATFTLLSDNTLLSGTVANPQNFKVNDAYTPDIDLRNASGTGSFTQGANLTLRTAGTYNWQFDASGNLTLPGAINTNLIVGNSAVGQVVIIANSAVSSDYWEFRTHPSGAPDGSITSALHVPPSDGANISAIHFPGYYGGGYLGWYNVNSWANSLTLISTNTVSITTEAQGGIPGETQWLFDTVGNLTLPALTGTPQTISLTSGGVGYTTADNVPTDSGPYGNGHGMTLNIVADTGNSNAVLSVTINTPGQGYHNGAVVTIDQPSSTGTATVTVDTVGNGVPSINYANGAPYGGTGGSANIIYNGLSNVSIPAANGNVTITANTQPPWIFGTDGTTVFPHNTLDTGNGNPLTIRTQNGNAYTQVDYESAVWVAQTGDDTTAANPAFASIATNLFTTDTPTVYIQTQKGSDGAVNTWTFDASGELYLPTGGRIGATKGGTMLDGGNGNSVSLTSFYANGYYAGCFTANPDGNAYITTYTGSENYTWNFDSTGALNLPIINNGPFGGFSGAIQTASAYPTLLAYGLGGHGGPELDWIDSDDPANTFSSSNTVRNTLYLNGNAGLYVGFNENGNTGPYTGHFQVDTLGNVQIPSQNVGNSTPNGTPGEATYLRGTRKIINGVYTGAQNPFAVELAAGPASTVVYTATNQSVQSVRVTFAVQSTGNGYCWEQFDVVATPSQDVIGTVNYVVSNRIKSTSTVTDTQVTATINGGQIEISLVPMTGQNGWASFDAVEFGLMVD